MAYVTLYELLTTDKAYAWTGRAVTDDHLTEAEEQLRYDWLSFDPRTVAPSLVAEHEKRPIAKAIAYLAAAIYDAERLDGEVEVQPGATVHVTEATAGDVRVKLAGSAALDGSGQLTGRVDWLAKAHDVLASAGLLAHRRQGHTAGAAVRITSPIINDI